MSIAYVQDITHHNLTLNEHTSIPNSVPRKQKKRLPWFSKTHGNFSTEFELSSDYELEGVIGNGAYGIVASGIHLPTGERVAVKKVSLFELDSVVCMRALREIKLLSYFKHDNIVNTMDVQFSHRAQDLKYVYIVQSYMDSDLSRVIKSQQLGDEHVRYFTYQLLRGLQSLHRENVIHRDLKPSNLLVSIECDLQICDFGLARGCNPHDGREADRNDPYMTEYVATRWYRAPEIFISKDNYGKAMDMWSVGCIVAEMIGGKPLFPGSNYADQLAKITGILGTQDPERIRKMTTFGRPVVTSRMYCKRIPFSTLYPHADPVALDLLTRMLEFFPQDRISCEEALAHPYFEGVAEELFDDHQDSMSGVCSEGNGLSKDFFKFESGTSRMNLDELRNLAFNELSSIASTFGYNRAQ